MKNSLCQALFKFTSSAFSDLKKFSVLFILICFSISANANNSIRCDGHLIEDEQIHPQRKYEIEKLCGQPDSKEGDNWIYVRPNQPDKVLHFNDNDELESIHDVN